MYNESLKEQIVGYGEIFEQKGLLNALEGNLSILERETGLMYLSPSAKSKLLLTTEMVAVLDREGKQLDGTLKHSSEYGLHRTVLEARTDCNAAVHTHAPYLTAYAYCGMDIEMRCNSSFYLGYAGKIPCLPYGEPGTPAIAAGLSELIRDNNIVLLGNHGAICVGRNMDDCLRYLDGAESILKTYMLAKMVGTPLDLSPEQVESLLQNHPFSKFYHHRNP